MVLPSRAELLKQRILTLAEYAKEVRRGTKLSKVACMQLYGSKVVPIPVPLQRNESLDQYEARFVADLSERNVTLAQLWHDANTERNRRISFARQQANEYNARRERALASLDTSESLTAVVATDTISTTLESSEGGVSGRKRDQPSDGMEDQDPPSKRLSRGDQVSPSAAVPGSPSSTDVAGEAMPVDAGDDETEDELDAIRTTHETPDIQATTSLLEDATVVDEDSDVSTQERLDQE